MQCRVKGNWFKPHWGHIFAGADVPQIFVFLGAIGAFGRNKKYFPHFLGGHPRRRGVPAKPPPPPPFRPPPPPAPSPPSNTCLATGRCLHLWLEPMLKIRETHDLLRAPEVHKSHSIAVIIFSGGILISTYPRILV